MMPIEDIKHKIEQCKQHISEKYRAGTFYISRRVDEWID